MDCSRASVAYLTLNCVVHIIRSILGLPCWSISALLFLAFLSCRKVDLYPVPDPDCVHFYSMISHQRKCVLLCAYSIIVKVYGALGSVVGL